MSCFKASDKSLKDFKFNPIKDIQYSFSVSNSNEKELRIYFLIDASHFVYEQNKNRDHVSSSELIFQIVDSENQKEIIRKVVDINILKSDFYQTKKNNYYESEVSFLIDKKPYDLNIKLIDRKSRNVWNKKTEINIDVSKYFSKLYLYYNNSGQIEKVKDDLSSDINEFNCSFY